MVVVMVWCGVCFGQTPAELLSEAEAAYADAAALSGDVGADGAYLRAAAAYAAVIEAGANSAALQRNLGNALFAAGELGEAMVAYRRAERIDPSDRRVREALAVARGRVRTAVEEGTRSRAEGALLWWRGGVPRAWLAWGGLAGWSVIWLGLLWKARGGPVVVAAGALVAFVGIGSLAAEWALSGRGEVVVVEDGVVARTGPDEAVYDAAFNEAVREGVEGVVIERREGWSRVRLRSGQEGWFPDWSVESI